MQNKNYTIRHLNDNEIPELEKMFNTIFHPEKVGSLARVMTESFPDIEKENWFIAAEAKSEKPVAGLVRIPWEWEIEGVRLKIAEQGIVGTLKEHRGHGLIRQLNEKFDQDAATENYDLQAIEGIPGFYHNFGYYFSLPLEQHLNLSLHVIPDTELKAEIKLATENDIPQLIAWEKEGRRHFSFSVCRNENHWRYIMGPGRKAEYCSDLLIFSYRSEKALCRVQHFGFGDGLIISEINEGISPALFNEILIYLKQRAIKNKKPYLRFNMIPESDAGKMLLARGAKEEIPWGWQIKIPSLKNLLTKIGTVLEKRLDGSIMNGYSGKFRISTYVSGAEISFNKGKISSICDPSEEEIPVLSIRNDVLPALVLGARSFSEIRNFRPDTFCRSPFDTGGDARNLTEILFPKTISWIYGEY